MSTSMFSDHCAATPAHSWDADFLRVQLEHIRDGNAVLSNEHLLEALLQAAAKMRGSGSAAFVDCDSVAVLGPVRGHASDLVDVLLHNVLPGVGCGDSNGNGPRALVFLGDYVNGSVQSCETVYVVALLILCLQEHTRVVPLIGYQEMVFLGEFNQIEDHVAEARSSAAGCTLQHELRLRSHRESAPGSAPVALHRLAAVFADFFAQLPLCCTVNGRYFCACGGLSESAPVIQKDIVPSRQDLIGCATNVFADSHKHAAAAEDGSHDGNRMRSLFFERDSDASSGARRRFSYNALCNFLTRNQLSCLLCGQHTLASDIDANELQKNPASSMKASGGALDSADCAEPGLPVAMHDCGYRLHRRHPRTQMPTAISLFSAPHFLGVQHNRGCFAWIHGNSADAHELSSAAVDIVQFSACSTRPLMLPFRGTHAFTWSTPLVNELAYSALITLLCGDFDRLKGKTVTCTSEDEENEAVSKMQGNFRVLCQHLKKNGLPLPSL